jgi:hypothetical protein
MSTHEDIQRAADRLIVAAMRPRGYSQSHARKVWKEMTAQHATRSLLHGSSALRLEHGKFPRLVPLNREAL